MPAPRRAIKRLIDFALSLVPSEQRPENIQIHEEPLEGSPHVAGLAGSGEVDIFLPDNLLTRKYPRRYAYRKAAGAIKFECWHEEVLATIAHELRHISQEHAPKSERPMHEEVDAEAFARFTLGVYRQRKRCRHET